MRYEYKDGYLSRILDHSSPSLDVELDGCKGEVMLHQSKLCRAILDFENADTITSKTLDGETLSSKTNRIIVTLKMGAGKTKLAIATILASKLPKMKPIYFCAGHGVFQTRIFEQKRYIDPTFVVVRLSVYGQWVDQIGEFSNLRVYKAMDSRSVVKLAKALHTDLEAFNASYDVVLVNYKTISGNVDYILEQCDNIFMQNKNKGKRIHMLLFNMLNKFYIRRLIYDDWDMLNIGTAPLENAGSCIYLSATESNAIVHIKIDYTNDPPSVFEAFMANPAYSFSHQNLRFAPHVYVDDQFLDESIEIGLKNSDCKMMPPKPIVYICNIDNAENQAINIISELSSDEKIIESVNNLESTSPSGIIRSLLAERLEPYKRAVKMIKVYGNIDIEKLKELPRAPSGKLFTQVDIELCIPIIYSYRNIANRVIESLRCARELVQSEENMLERVRTRIAENSCPICIESIKIEPAAIMHCCNAIIHVSCAMRCRSNRCPLCRVDYGRTFLETFVCLHHDTDTTMLLDATSSVSIINNADEKNESEAVTKFTVLRNIVQCNYSNIVRTAVDLNKFKSIIFDEKSDIAPIEDKKKIKVLIYCSSNQTLNAIEKQLIGIIDYSRLTPSSTSTYKKIRKFREASKPTVILANSWGDAAGIDFKMASDVIILNYINSMYVMQQMLGRVLRVSQKHRPRIWLPSYQNEADRWMQTYVKSAPSSN